jgi:hypothetical protein
MQRIKIKDNVDLSELLKGWGESELSYDLNTPFDEFISVTKTTRVISQYGYNGLVIDWWKQGLLEYVPIK